jgi:hypothetical protein
MDIYIAQIISLTVYKLASLVTGLLLSYMGYKLFMAGVWGNAGDAEGAFGNNKLVIKKAAPGTFFILMGAIVIGLTISNGLSFNTASEQHQTEMQDEKPAVAD